MDEPRRRVERRFAGQTEVVRGHDADGAGGQQVPRDTADGDRPFAGVRALQDFVEEIEQHPALVRVTGAVEHAFQPRQRRHEVRQAVLE